MSGFWWEVWGIEKDEDPPAILLFRFPGVANGWYAALQAKEQLEQSGATDVEIRRTTE